MKTLKIPEYRIKEEIFSSGHSNYIPQRKFLFFWIPFFTPYVKGLRRKLKPSTFYSDMEARQKIQEDIARRKAYHKSETKFHKYE